MLQNPLESVNRRARAQRKKQDTGRLEFTNPPSRFMPGSTDKFGKAIDGYDPFDENVLDAQQKSLDALTKSAHLKQVLL